MYTLVNNICYHFGEIFLLIEFKNVSKDYPSGTHALHNINLKINNGDFVFVVGSSGAGKSTFLKLIMAEEKVNKR